MEFLLYEYLCLFVAAGSHYVLQAVLELVYIAQEGLELTVISLSQCGFTGMCISCIEHTFGLCFLVHSTNAGLLINESIYMAVMTGKY